MEYSIYRPSGIGSDGFLAYRISPPLLKSPTDPYLRIDLFELSSPTFPPRPLAGLVSAAYVFPESVGSLRFRDSLGGDSLLEPGGLCWTRSGRGLVQEEVPSGGTATGVKFLVNMPRETELDAPRALQFPAGSLPSVPLSCGRATLLAGEWGGARGPAEGDSPLMVADIELAGGSFVLPAPEGWTSFAFLRSGRLRIGGEELLPGEVLVHGSPVACDAGPGARLTLFQGQPLQEPVEHFGPFSMSDRLRNRLAVRSYRSGGMGSLEPSS